MIFLNGMNIKSIIPTINIISYIYQYHKHLFSLVNRTIIASSKFPLDRNKILTYINDSSILSIPIKLKKSEDNPNRYIIIDGHHRFTANVSLGKTFIEYLLVE